MQDPFVNRYNNKSPVKQIKTTLSPKIKEIIKTLQNRKSFGNVNFDPLVEEMKKVFHTTTKKHYVCAKCKLNKSNYIPR